MRRLGAVIGLAVALVTAATVATAQTQRVLDWSDLDGWARDDHAAARAVFLTTCSSLPDAWDAACAAAAEPGDARGFFERHFRPVLISDGAPALFTGYYEPELSGSRTRTDRFRFPIHRKPPEVSGSRRWLTRGEIERSRVLQGRGLEIAWLDDPVDKFFLQVQGSGRIRLPGGEALRVGFGGRNGHPYRSVGRELVRLGLFEPHQVSAGAIKRWVRANPEAGAELLRHNPSYIFFREITRIRPDQGPIGAMNRPVTEGRSIAVDPDHVPLGAPVWVEKDGARALRRLMIAQDTGSAIKGAQRADIFYGSGDEAGRVAGTIRDPGRMVTLLPVSLAPGRAGN